MGANNKRRLSMVLFEKLDKSVIVNFIIWLRSRFLSLKTKAVGAFFVSLGAYALVKGLIDFFIGSVEFTSSFYCGIAVLLSALPMLYFDMPLKRFFSASRLGRLWIKLSGEVEDRSGDTTAHGITAVGFILGALLGYFNIILTLKIIGAIFVVALVISSPIQGYFLSLVLMALPLGEEYLTVLMAVTAVSVVLKLLRLKLTFPPFGLKMGLVLIPLAVYELAVFITRGSGLVYLLGTVLCFFAPAVFNRAVKVQNGLKLFICPTVLVALFRLLAFALNYVSNRFEIHTFGISFDAYLKSGTTEAFLYLITLLMLACFFFSHNKPYKRFFIALAFFVLAVSAYFTYSFEISVRHGFIYSLFVKNEFLPVVIVSAYCICAVILSLLCYNRLKWGRHISLRTKNVFEKYDFHHYILSISLVVAFSFISAALFPYSENMYLICFFIMGFFASYAADFSTKAHKAVGASFDKQDSLSASIDI